MMLTQHPRHNTQEGEEPVQHPAALRKLAGTVPDTAIPRCQLYIALKSPGERERAKTPPPR